MAKRILLADDSITIQKVVELTFSDGDYEVVAVNNGAKAVQKLSEMRPDIILSDIIMPEKNGYEVCEFVKSHPDFKTIPVILLTGTFEPFDPDRAEKAGCDAVVTKPFESQSLIHKVEELIAQSRSAAPSAPEPAFPAAAPSPEPAWASGFASAPQAPMPAPQPPAAAEASFGPAESPFDSTGGASLLMRGPAAAEHEPDIFGAPGQESSASPFASPGPPEGFGGGETRALPRMSFEDLQQAAAPPAPEPEPSPWGSPAPEPPAYGGETRAFPRMNLDELQQMAGAPQPPGPAQPEASPWSTPEPEPPAFGGETRAFPQLKFDDLQRMAPPQQAAEPEPSWSEPAARSWPSTPEPLAVEPSAADSYPIDGASPFTDAVAPAADVSPFTAPPPPQEPPVGPSLAPAVEVEAWSPAVETAPAAAAPAEAPTGEAPLTADLTDSQIDRIARRVVELMSEQVVRSIAWEVIPDMAEMVVKERLRQLEGE
jgi:CheY-like chemotaxis protein